MPWKQREESRMWQKERVIQELRSQGKRMTKQRMVLLDVILSGKWNCCKDWGIQQMLPLQPAGPSLCGEPGRGLAGLETEHTAEEMRAPGASFLCLFVVCRNVKMQESPRPISGFMKRKFCGLRAAVPIMKGNKVRQG